MSSGASDSRWWAGVMLALCLLAGSTGAEEDDLLILYKHGQFRRAEAVAQKRVDANPGDVLALRLLARVRAAAGRFDEATRYAERAVAAAPKSADAHFALALVSGTHAQRASLLKKPGLARKFKRETETALALDPNHAEALEGMIEFHRQAPGLVGGDKKKAVEFADRLMRVDSTIGWVERSGIAFDAQDSAGALRDLRRAVAVAGQPTAKLALANYLAAPWRAPDEAARLASEIVEAEPWRAIAWALLTMRAASQKRYEDLNTLLSRAEAAVPGNLGPHYQAARVMIVEGGAAARAAALLRRYLEVDPEYGAPSHAAARWRLALALERQGRKPEAIKELETAIKLDPKLEGPKKDLRRLRK